MRNLLSSALRRLCCAVVCAAVASPAIAIENGQPDTAYGNVGALGFDVDGPAGPTPPFGICSGFVISDRAFVTAAHCLTPVQDIAQSWAVTLEPGSPENPAIRPGVLSLVEFNVTEFPILTPTVSTTMVHLHPRFDPETMENDIAVLEFPASTFDSKPVQFSGFRLLDRLDRLRVLDRIAVGVVGFGAEQSLENFRFAIPGYRKRGVSSIGTLSTSRFTLEPTPVRDASVLPGDSGSPVFVLDRAVGLTSFTDIQRLDVPSIRRFLRPFVSD